MLVDTHTHCIYGMDDGASTPKESLNMFRMASKGGVRHVFCTSHIMPGVRPFDLEAYKQRIQELQLACDKAGLDICLHFGSEIRYTTKTQQQLRDGAVPTLDGSDLILIEFRYSTSLADIEHAIKELENDGWRVIIAHVERCKALHSTRSLQQLKQKTGALMQMNVQTVIGENAGILTGLRARRMLSKGLIDIVASDAHDTVNRPFCLEYAYRELERKYGREYADRLCGDTITKLLWKDTGLPKK